MEMAIRHSGSCFCGAVEFSVSGDPVAMGYCHCRSCRHWSAGPVNAFTLWSPGSVVITKGGDSISAFQKTERSIRKWCAKCGGHLFTEHPHWNLIDVYAATIPTQNFKPALHVNYQETILPLPDGLPKYKDVPKEMGGSGVIVPD
jgi:hypothetical protein